MADGWCHVLMAPTGDSKALAWGPLKNGSLGKRQNGPDGLSAASFTPSTDLDKNPDRHELAGSSARIKASMSGQLTLRFDGTHRVTNCCSATSKA